MVFSDFCSSREKRLVLERRFVYFTGHNIGDDRLQTVNRTLLWLFSSKKKTKGCPAYIVCVYIKAHTHTADLREK
jgi:hypothetical protein